MNPAQSTSPVCGTLTAPDGQSVTVWRWPQMPGRPVLHWAHGTGLHARCYTPLLDRLSAFANVSAWDMRGHGASSSAANLRTYKGWETYYQDLSAMVDQADGPLWLAGHSIGAMCCIALASLRPQKVQGLLLVDPVIMSPWQAWVLPLTKRIGREPRAELIAAAARRREFYESRAVAQESYRGRGTFRTWPESSLALYVQHGFIDDGPDGVRLAAAPAWESATFAGEHDPWPNVRRLGRWGRPVTVLAADVETTFPQRNRGRFARLVPQATMESVTGTTHSLAVEQPDRVIDAAASMLGVTA